MRFNTLFFLLILSCLCLALAQVSYDDCCLKYVKLNQYHSIQKHAVTYRRQIADGGCNIPAIIFIMKRKGRKICADPKAEWAGKLIQKIDKKELQEQAKPKRRG